DRPQSSLVPRKLVPDSGKAFLLGLFMGLVGFRDGLFYFLVGIELVVAERDRMVLAGEQREDVDIVLAGLRSVDQPAGAGALAQRIVDIFRIVGEHAEGGLTAHYGRGAGEALHQHGGDLLLAGRGAVVGAFGRYLVDVVDRAEADRLGVHDVVDEILAVLA